MTLTKGEGHMIRSTVTDVEMSAFSECFLLYLRWTSSFFFVIIYLRTIISFIINFFFTPIFSFFFCACWLSVGNQHSLNTNYYGTLNTNYYGTAFDGVPGSFYSEQGTNTCLARIDLRYITPSEDYGSWTRGCCRGSNIRPKAPQPDMLNTGLPVTTIQNVSIFIFCNIWHVNKGPINLFEIS